MIWASVVKANFPKLGVFALVPCTVYLVLFHDDETIFRNTQSGLIAVGESLRMLFASIICPLPYF